MGASEQELRSSNYIGQGALSPFHFMVHFMALALHGILLKGKEKWLQLLLT